jgi:hypothetical protein
MKWQVFDLSEDALPVKNNLEAREAGRSKRFVESSPHAGKRKNAPGVCTPDALFARHFINDFLADVEVVSFG